MERRTECNDVAARRLAGGRSANFSVPFSAAASGAAASGAADYQSAGPSKSRSVARAAIYTEKHNREKYLRQRALGAGARGRPFGASDLTELSESIPEVFRLI
ncbi:hypothetical protein EVAR_41715_1 [Eumeta japonica]|uniref:Uncharacterized protein n=1 Tax=Eumeta variegata TaxID=151549 RepID=A0A4C1XFM9_EUMVA|nr:hypothetical protein EVAR_41715_1 [Eumeta japonica]